jgi:hypothetical protein
MVDFRNQTEKSFLQILKGTTAYQRIIATAQNWDEVVTVIDSFNIIYTPEQLAYVKEKQWDLNPKNMNNADSKVKITIKHKNFEWVKEALSFEHGVKLAEDLQEKLGLIGRTYVSSSCGKETWIR